MNQDPVLPATPHAQAEAECWRFLRMTREEQQLERREEIAAPNHQSHTYLSKRIRQSYIHPQWSERVYQGNLPAGFEKIDEFQGGFDAAYVMTMGGPAGASTTLSYYIYNNAFVWFKMGYAASIAWVLFFLVFIATILNWKYGGKRVHYF